MKLLIYLLKTIIHAYRQLDVSMSSPGFGLGSGTLVESGGDNLSRVKRIAIGSSVDMVRIVI